MTRPRDPATANNRRPIAPPPQQTTHPNTMSSTNTTSDETETDADAQAQADDPEIVPDADAAPSLDDQEWTLGQLRSGVISFRGMQFEIEEPATDEEMADLIAASSSPSELFRRAIETLLVGVTSDHLDRMTPKERALLANKALEWFGIEDFVDEGAVEDAVGERL